MTRPQGQRVPHGGTATLSPRGELSASGRVERKCNTVCDVHLHCLTVTDIMPSSAGEPAIWPRSAPCWHSGAFSARGRGGRGPWRGWRPLHGPTYSGLLRQDDDDDDDDGRARELIEWRERGGKRGNKAIYTKGSFLILSTALLPSTASTP